MRNTDHIVVKNTQKPATTNDAVLVETDFGTRTISDQNFSKIVALPKAALMNCGNPVKVNVKLVQAAGARYLKLTPIDCNDLEEI